MVLKTVIARAVSSHFQKEAHFAKMKEALEKVPHVLHHTCMCMFCKRNLSELPAAGWSWEYQLSASWYSPHMFMQMLHACSPASLAPTIASTGGISGSAVAATLGRPR